MVDHDLELARQEQTLATAGHRVVVRGVFAWISMEKTPYLRGGTPGPGRVGHLPPAARPEAMTTCSSALAAELDLRDRRRVEEFFRAEQPEYVFLAAAKVGGILANSTYPADFLRDNLSIQNNVIDAACAVRREKVGLPRVVLHLSEIRAAAHCAKSTCSPAPLEPTNEWYAVAKIAGIKMAQAYRKQYGFNAISLMPTNLYGPDDNFDLRSSHVLPALLRKSHEAVESGAPELVVWGTGAPRREFLHVDDMADAALFLMLHYDEPEIVNVGTGSDLTIRELAELIMRIAGCPAGWYSTRPSPTARPVNCWISRASPL